MVKIDSPELTKVFNEYFSNKQLAHIAQFCWESDYCGCWIWPCSVVEGWYKNIAHIPSGNVVT